MSKSEAKILVLGDSGVGKSSLIHLICHNSVLQSPQWTIGCSIEIKLHGDYFLQFWDIGGSRGHKLARSFLYQDYHGIMLVFDATNNKSRTNLEEWLLEVPDRKADTPITTVATKIDLLNENPRDLENPVIYLNTQVTDNSNILSDFFGRVTKKAFQTKTTFTDYT